MKRFLHDNGLSIALLSIFLIAVIGQALTGWSHENKELAEHGAAAVGLGVYLTGGDFLSALFENWESEFLQMWAYVMLTAYLFQRGSPESKDPDSNPSRPTPATPNPAPAPPKNPAPA